jgi:hypothetical protein
LHGEELLRVVYGGVDLEAVADDAGVLQQFRDFGLVVTGDERGIEAVEGRAVVVALAEDGNPA